MGAQAAYGDAARLRTHPLSQVVLTVSKLRAQGKASGVRKQIGALTIASRGADGDEDGVALETSECEGDCEVSFEG